jgi:prepilin-type N-terminal cleavage/methylation domain-containing protein
MALEGNDTMSIEATPCSGRRGFTLVELTVVVVIIGVLAAFGVPRLFKAVERSKAAESLTYLQSIRMAQERQHARMGTYASVITDLDVQLPSPKYFSVGAISAGSTGSLEDSWSLSLTRLGASAGYGAYTVTFTEQGYDPTNSTIESFPEIHPMVR